MVMPTKRTQWKLNNVWTGFTLWSRRICSSLMIQRSTLPNSSSPAFWERSPKLSKFRLKAKIGRQSPSIRSISPKWGFRAESNTWQTQRKRSLLTPFMAKLSINTAVSRLRRAWEALILTKKTPFLETIWSISSFQILSQVLRWTRAKYPSLKVTNTKSSPRSTSTKTACKVRSFTIRIRRIRGCPVNFWGISKMTTMKLWLCLFSRLRLAKPWKTTAESDQN